MKKLIYLSLCCLSICAPVCASEDDAALEKSCKVTREQAHRIALKEVPGTITDTDIDKSVEGTIYWSVDVKPTKGVEREVHINAQSGAVIRIEKDDD